MSADWMVRVLAVVVARGRRARFVEEWGADLLAGEEFGFSRTELCVAAARVAAVLAWARMCRWVRGPRTPAELMVAGSVGGVLLVSTDFPVGMLAPAVALELISLTLRGLRRLRRET